MFEPSVSQLVSGGPETLTPLPSEPLKVRIIGIIQSLAPGHQALDLHVSFALGIEQPCKVGRGRWLRPKVRKQRCGQGSDHY